MGQNNIEKQIREKLNTREIQPSAQAWDRLDAMLSVAEEKKTKRSFGWLYIAASILVFATVGTFLYNQENQIHPTHNVAGNDTVTNTNNTKATTPIQEKVNEISTPIAPSQELAQTEKSNPNPTTNTNKTITNQKTTATQVQNTNWQNQATGIINQKQEEITATHPKSEETISPKAITVNPELLAMASNEKSSSSRVRVNANNLLSEVDTETETMTFKGRIIKGVSKNYKEVKEAIASRNFDE